ncbi:urate hydroxylase PuuD [Oharaeibacter diazotrophicus]|uniref:Putative membrane protein n=1 Tax=Oharaeibacter diazotrophicus TaxID=1920512 RepID=A0A4R6RK64_9HYPH|nr:urate hydroxylase PuuD [Oharaeibacter diazotrophicus]TDP87041.1 putative membrane protein [Oharaeibacter diazotrophicus]BBE71016.1 cytochrome c [Pleomorphomonas sp. SM30]GLS77766.1 cysteine desulfurase [Oharaeibacter diazotrophicus]
MLAFAAEWLNILIRWGHLVAGIGWIGTSFYFIALDLSLKKRAVMNPGVYGTAWEVHGGGFYHVEKYMVAPDQLPEDLIWYKWEAYLTFLTGFALLTVQYYLNPSAYLIDPSILPMRPADSIILSIVSLLAGWLIYDRVLCRSPLGRNTPLLALAVFLLIMTFSYMFTHVYSGRGAFIHVGALVGTIMAANVFMVIVPNQKKITEALLRGEAPDPRLGAMGKQRSVHNNYLTLPVLLMMVSNHYPILTGHPKSWLLVALILVIGAMARHFLNRHEAGDPLKEIWWTLPIAAIALVVALVMTAPEKREAVAGGVADADVLRITATHCVMCHAAKPTHDGFPEPPKGVVLTDIDHIRRYAPLIELQAVKSTAMPLGNETGMTDDERRQLGDWIASQ